MRLWIGINSAPPPTSYPTKMATPEDRPFPNSAWQKVEVPNGHFDNADYHRDIAWKLTVMQAAIILGIISGAGWLLSAVASPPPVTVLADGRFFSGQVLGDLSPDEETVMLQFEDTLEVLFTRTERGGVQELEHFLMPGVKDIIDQKFAPTTEVESGYLQQLRVLEPRVLRARPGWVVMGYRTLLSSRTLNGYQPNELFLVAGFRRDSPNASNPLGWKLAKLIHDETGEVFYEQELTEAAERRLGLTE